MSNEYVKADDGTVELVDAVIAEHHQNWIKREPSVVVDVWFLDKTADGHDVPMVKAGRDVPGKVSISSKEELQKWPERGHVQLTLCKHTWDNAELKERRAMVDHLCSHVVRTDEGNDPDKTFPDLGKAKPDVYVEGFSAVAQRHGEAALEHRQIYDATKKTSQLGFWKDGEAA
ncbi:MAG: putative metallopeptidase [Myxococcota bacterium]